MKNTVSLLTSLTLFFVYACATPSYKPTPSYAPTPGETYQAPWSKYERITFAEAVRFMLNKELRQGKNKDDILDIYLRTFHYDEYKARQQTRYQLTEFKTKYMNELVNNFDPDKKFIYIATPKLEEYDPSVSGFRIQNIYGCYRNPQNNLAEDFGLSRAFLMFDVSQFALPVAPEAATKFLMDQRLKNNYVILLYVYRLSECQRPEGKVLWVGLHNPHDFVCSTIIDGGYLYPTDNIRDDMKPIGQIIKVPTRAKNTNMVRSGNIPMPNAKNSIPCINR